MVPLFLYTFLFLLSSLPNPCQNLKPNTTEYLKLKLIHRTSLGPPLDLQQTLTSDTTRLLSFLPTQNSVSSPIISGASTGSAQYFVDFHIGKQKLLLIVDTGSDLVWVTCSACINCTKHPPGSSFFPRHSPSFHPIHCYNRACRLVPNPPTPCNLTRLHSSCLYEYTYSDQSKTAGIFARETVTMNSSTGREIKISGVAFGCGFHGEGNGFNGANGVMGLGRGPISFASQLGKHFGNKFSYCLMDYTLSPPPTSYLFLGDVTVDGKGKRKIRFTPLQQNPLSPTFYYVGIEKVSLQGVVLPINPTVWALDNAGNGGTVIDSGTSITFLARPAYRAILTAFRSRVKYPRVVRANFDLCVNVSGISKPRFPRLRVHFLGGAVFSPPEKNYFLTVVDGVRCLALQAVNSPFGFSVLGNLMQQGFTFVFDMDESRVGFSRAGCSLL